MKKILNESIIVESVPIIGVFNKIINTNLKIVPQVEFFTFSREHLILDETNSGLDTYEFLFWLAGVRAGRLKSLVERMEDEDFNPKYDRNSNTWLGEPNDLLINAFKKGFVKEIVAMKPGSIMSRSGDATLLTNLSGLLG